jgi:YVTN family beta-propeller protein
MYQNKGLIMESIKRLNLYLIMLPIVFLMSNFSLASNGVSSEKLIKFKPKTGDAVAIPLEDARLSSVIESMMSDLNDEAVLTGEIPLPDVDHDALVAIAKSLAKLKAMKERGQSYTYKPLRELIEKNLPVLDEKSLHEFLNAALFLDLSMLYKPAVAIWVDLLIGEKPVTTEQITQAEALLEKNLERLKKNRLLAPDLEPLFHGYFGHFKKLVPNEQKSIKLPSGTAMMDIIQVGAKLYFTTLSSDTVTPIDAATLELEKPIAVGPKPRALVAAGNKIYVGNSGDNTISIIDTATDTVIGQIQAGIGKPLGPVLGGVINLAIVGDKLYAWVRYDKTLFVIDLRSEQVVGELPFRTDAVHAMKAVGDILYVLTAKNIVMVDTKTDKVSAPLFNDEAVRFWKSGYPPINLVISGDKAYTVNEKRMIEIFDLKTKEKVKDVFEGIAIASLGTSVFAGWYGTKMITIWNSTSKKGNEIVGSIETPYSVGQIFVVGDTLYVRGSYHNDELTQIKIDSYYLVD